MVTTATSQAVVVPIINLSTGLILDYGYDQHIGLYRVISGGNLVTISAASKYVNSISEQLIFCADYHSGNPNDSTYMAETVYLFSSDFDGDKLAFQAELSAKVFESATEIRCLGVAIDSENPYKNIVLISYRTATDYYIGGFLSTETLREHFKLSGSTLDTTMFPKKASLEILNGELFFAYGTSSVNSASNHYFISHFKNLWDQSGQSLQYAFCSSWEKVFDDIVPSGGLNLYSETGNVYLGDIFEKSDLSFVSDATSGMQ